MNKPIQLSYIVSTRNRLPFLRVTLQFLLANIRDDEEIVVVDGNSNDGTKEYLTDLYVQGKIHRFVSENDKNQAHGWNKAILLARGELIKKIIDDDLFCFSAIRDCKRFMLKNPSVDLCISDTLETTIMGYKNIGKQSRLNQYLGWKNGKTKSFTFGDVSLILRKSSIPLLGLYDTSFAMIDYEFALRVSYIQANIAYYTGFNAMSISHPDNITSSVMTKTLELEGKRANPMYEYGGDNSEISTWSKLKIFVGKTLQKAGVWNKKRDVDVSNTESRVNLALAYDYCYQRLNETNLKKQGEFL